MLSCSFVFLFSFVNNIFYYFTWWKKFISFKSWLFHNFVIFWNSLKIQLMIEGDIPVLWIIKLYFSIFQLKVTSLICPSLIYYWDFLFIMTYAFSIHQEMDYLENKYSCHTELIYLFCHYNSFFFFRCLTDIKLLVILSNRISELRVVELLDGLCEKMQDYTLMKVEYTSNQIPLQSYFVRK